jgi:probable O-glycosylation ligase (exosortase A-associated)
VRDVMMLGMMLFLVPMSLRSGYTAYLLWGWAGMASIVSYMYGYMASFQFVQLFAIIAIGQLLLRKDPENKPFKFTRTAWLLILFGLQMTLSATFAYEGHPRRWELAADLLKTILFCLLMPMLVTSRFRIHVLVLVIAISTGFHGLVDGMKFIASAGGHLARGIVKFGDNNHYAMVLVMVIPLLIYCYRYASNQIVRFGFITLTPIVVLAVVATQSRGGLVCLVIVGLRFVLKSRRKVAGLIGVTLCAVIVLQLAPERWTARMDTIADASDDSSLMGRLGAWRVSSAIALSNPLFGGGPHAVEMGYVWDKFKSEPSLLDFLTNADMNGLPGRGRAAHSIYFETMGDLGFVGFTLFLLLLGNAFLTAREIVRTCDTVGAPLDWAHDLAQVLSSSILAYSIGGALLSAAYFELPYMMFMLLEVIKQRVAETIAVSTGKNSSLQHASGLMTQR